MSSSEEMAHAIAGAGGGALSMIVTYPLVTLSTLAQTKKKKKEETEGEEKTKDEQRVESEEVRSTLNKILVKVTSSTTYQEAAEIINNKGLLGLYAGLESALYGISLSNFIYYYFYELTSNVFLKANALARRGKGLSTVQSIITGAIAGAITCVGSNPFWVANTRMMTAKRSNKSASSSTFKTLLQIVENDGPATLFAGVLPALVLVINPIIQYTIFEQVRNMIISKGGKTSFTAGKAFLIGAFGKLVATSLTYPYIALKARMHVKKKSISEKSDGNTDEIKLSMYQEIRKIIRDEGLEGLYRGLSVKLVQSISTAAFLFYFKEELFTGSVKLVEIFRMMRIRKSVAH